MSSLQIQDVFEPYYAGRKTPPATAKRVDSERRVKTAGERRPKGDEPGKPAGKDH